MIKNYIMEDLKKAVQSLGFKSTDILISIPENSDFGDYSTNVALQLAKLEQGKHYQSSLEIANKILEKFGHPHYLEAVEVAGPGFINFFIKKEFLSKDIEEILEKRENFGKTKKFSGKKARVEFVSANPTGPLHFGNARCGPIGDVLANVLEAVGYEVLREYIHNDVGEQVKALGETIKAHLTGEATEENQYKGEYVQELVVKLKDHKGKSAEELGNMAVGILFEENLKDINSMGIKFDLIVKESDLRLKVPAAIKDLSGKGMIRKRDGALWFAPSDEFLKDRETVVVKKDGGYTYFSSDIVYHSQKFEGNPDLVIDIFGSNHHGHVARLQAVIKALGFDIKKFHVILYQYVRFKKGLEIVKMSKRAGNFITAREVLEEVGKDAMRFWLLRFSPQTHIDLDLNLLKETSSKNPVYYVQYAHARMVHIIAKAKNLGSEADLSLFNEKLCLFNEKLCLLQEDAEIALIKHLSTFPDLLLELADTFAVHKLTDYAVSLSDLFHKFYEECPVLYASSEKLVNSRLALVQASKIALKNTLDLLGISAPEKM